MVWALGIIVILIVTCLIWAHLSYTPIIPTEERRGVNPIVLAITLAALWMVLFIIHLI